MAEMINRDAPLSGLSSLMAMKGRQGDTELIHMTKPEIAGLASLGKLTINPDTGLPEAFSFKQFLPALAGLAITGATGGLMGPAAAAALQGAFTGSSFVLPALAAGATSAVVNKGDIGAVAFDALLAGAGGALSGATIGAETAGTLAPNATAAVGQQVTADAAAQTIVKQQAADAVAKEIAQQAAVETTGLTGATTTGALSNVTAAPVTQVAPKPVEVGLGNVLAEKFTGDATKQIGIGSLTTGDVTRAGLGILPTAGLMATGTPTTGGGMLESMKVDTPEIAARKAAESSYGTRAADEVRQPAKADGLTTQEVLSSALGRSDPLTYLSGSNSSNVSAPSSLYGGPTGVVGQPARGAGPVGGYVPAASGGSLQDLYERMGGDIQTFKGLVEGGEIGSDGMSDDIEFDVIDGGEKGPDNALLSKDEYVIDAHTVAALGNGSTDAGADRLDKFVANLRNKAYNKGKQPKQLNGLKELATLMS
jgi:hypothetical protein